MKKLKLCNVHKLALSNEGEGRKPIHIPFGTWAYDDKIDQTLDREHAEAIAADLAGKIAAGEPGIPVYQGHPDVPEYAGKYPDKGALGWVKKILVNENGMDLEVEWDRDPGKGFGWFSPYWTGDDPGPGATGKKNVIVDGLTSVGLVNNPNIREFRLANEAGENLTQRRGEAEVAAFELPTHLLALARRFDERAALANVIDANGMGHSDENGQFDGSGSGGGGVGDTQPQAKEKLKQMLKSAAVSIDKGGRPTKDDIVFEYNHKMYYVGKDNEHMVKGFSDRGLVKRVKGYHRVFENDGKGALRNFWHLKEKGALDSLVSELAARHDADKFNAAASKAAKDPTAMKFNEALAKARKAKDGKWTSGGGAVPKNVNVPNANIYKHSLSKIESRSGKADKINGILRNERKNMKEAGTEFRSGSISGREHREQRRDLRAVHVAAILSGLSYNRATHQYE